MCGARYVTMLGLSVRDVNMCYWSSGSTETTTTQLTSTTTTDEPEEVQDQSIRITLEGHTLETVSWKVLKH